jgi:hypothetical protein
MKTETTTTVWEVVRGFGDIVDAPRDCFDVEVLKRKFINEADAAAFAESHYDARIGTIMRRMPDWWKSFFVIVRPMTATVPTAAVLADAFDRRLRDDIGDENYAEVICMNRTPEYERACASHDFCDANVTMLEAMMEFGITPDDDFGLALFNAAWDAWREKTK